MQHTHFGSATFNASAFLAVATFGTLWRLVAFHGIGSSRPLIRGLSKAMLLQY